MGIESRTPSWSYAALKCCCLCSCHFNFVLDGRTKPDSMQLVERLLHVQCRARERSRDSQPVFDQSGLLLTSAH